MCLLQSKAPPISKIDPTLLFLPVFKMYRQRHIYFIALKHLFHSLHPSISPRLGDFHVVIVHISGKIFAVDHTIGSYEDFMDLHSSSGDKNVMVGQNVMVGHALLKGG